MVGYVAFIRHQQQIVGRRRATSAIFRREDYWRTRLSGDAATTADSLIVHDHGSVTERFTQHLGRQLPELVAEIVPGDVKRLYLETWRPRSAYRLPVV
jgi:hypothetical protein